MKAYDRLLWLLQGHHVNGRLVRFPHLCPLVNCAIARWLEAKEMRRVFEALQED